MELISDTGELGKLIKEEDDGKNFIMQPAFSQSK